MLKLPQVAKSITDIIPTWENNQSGRLLHDNLRVPTKHTHTSEKYSLKSCIWN